MSLVFRLVSILLVLATAPLGAATYPVVDTFPGSGPLSHAWTETTAANEGYVALQQSHGTAIPSTAGAQSLAIYTGATFTNDQFSQVKFVGPTGTDSSTGPCVRMNAAGDGVCYLAHIGQIYLLRAGAGIGDTGAHCPKPASGDTIELSVVGDQYTCKDITTGVSGSSHNNTYATGAPAVLVDQRKSTDYKIVDFIGDCIPSCTASTPVPPEPEPPAHHTWYVRPDGGTRYSSNVPTGQCDGLGDTAYSGHGVNQRCAFKDVRFLWSDASYTYGTEKPGWGWVIAGGDTVILRGSIANGVSYRVGANSQTTYCDDTGCWGITSSPGASGAPPIPSGTAEQHTRFLGENYAACTSPTAKTQLHGGAAAGGVFSLAGSSYVDVACIDITDFSKCGRSSQSVSCDQTQDYAQNGIAFSNTSTHDTLTDVRVHGMATSGMVGPTGDGVTLTRVDLLGNASAGWNMDDGTAGTGHLTLEAVNIEWNGCAEEYPITHPLPYADCTDQDSGGYGDGLGTATVHGTTPWTITVDHAVVAYNTQDGLDLLHLQGGGSTSLVKNSLMYGNMGQQLKVGASGTAYNNLIVGNCNAMRQNIPGTPPGYNSKLSLFCRAGGSAVLVTEDVGATTVFSYNTLYTAATIGLEVSSSCVTDCHLKYENNIFVGFTNNAANGNPTGSGQNPTPIYFDNDNQNLSVPGSSFSHNSTFGQRDNWTCPQATWGEVNGLCVDPKLVDMHFPLYGFGNMSPSSHSPVLAKGKFIPEVTTDFAGTARHPVTPTIGAYETTISTKAK